jgi:glycosyltransferase involved in cell wall biosynthesis
MSAVARRGGAWTDEHAMSAVAGRAPGQPAVARPAPRQRAGPAHSLAVATIITRLEGGAGWHALRGLQGLDRDAFTPVIITGSSDERLAARAAAHGIEVILAPELKPTLAPASDLRTLRWLTGLLTDLRPDVVHTHCAKAGAIGRLAARRAGVDRIVHTYHGFPFHEFQSAPRRRAYIEAERRLGRITDVGLCVGTGVAVEAIRRGILAPERVRTIGVPIDNEGAGPAADDLAARKRARARLGVPDGSLVVGAVGRLTYQKAPEDFVAAIGALGRADVTGVWVGGGELAESVAELASDRPVILAGERADVPELLPAFDVFALSSRYEGLPTVIAEAMACGVPVVATAVNAVADLVEPGVTGTLVPPARPDLMAAAIGHVLDSPAQAAEMVSAARDRVGHRYGIQALAAVLATVYVAKARSESVNRAPTALAAM